MIEVKRIGTPDGKDIFSRLDEVERRLGQIEAAITAKKPRSKAVGQTATQDQSATQEADNGKV